MIVKIGNQSFDSDSEEIIIILNTEEKDKIYKSDKHFGDWFVVEITKEEPKINVGDMVSAIVLRPYNGSTLTVNGKVTYVFRDRFRVIYNGNRYIEFYMTDIGQTVTIISRKRD